MTPPLIHVVDDDEAVRSALLRLLTAAGHEARGYESTGDFLLQPLTDRPGCLLLDLQMPGPSGIELQEELLRRGIGLPVVFLTGRADIETSVRAMKSGASDFLTKPVDSATLLAALRRALALDAERRAANGEATRLRALFESLTPRERQVFDRVAKGRLNKQIADDLGIAERTVKLQRSQVMTKLQCGSAAELGRFAERLQQLSS